MLKPPPIRRVLFAHFFQSMNGREPVRQWLKTLDTQDRKIIGNDIKTAELGWPIGMPLVRKMGTNLWELRIDLHPRCARILFTVWEDRMILLHGFIKKSRETPQTDLNLAHTRLKQLLDSLAGNS